MPLKILLVDFKTYYPSPPLSLGLLAAYAQTDQEIRGNIEFEILECPRAQPIAESARAIVEANADLVGIGDYAWCHRRICAVLDLLGRSGRELPPIVIGGPNAAGTFGIELLEQYEVLSALVEGEGEPAALDFCRSLVDTPTRNPFAAARNCIWRDESGALVRNSLGHRIEHLEEIPSPDLTGILRPSPSPIFYETNRGCPYRCAFCYWGNNNSKVYRLSLERIAEEMEFFAKNGVHSFWIADANFGIFRSDAEVAQIMAEASARHGYPFQHVGVNWAKESRDQVLELARILRAGRMTCTTTLALQSVTPEAGRLSERYSLPAAKFKGLMSAAAADGLDTYTDLIWGLPGEDKDDFIAGLDSVVSTGVPAILIHQLYLLPGTAFWDKKADYGFRLLSETVDCQIDETERSPYWEYVVVSHPKMSLEDMMLGARLMGINHAMHNHNLGMMVNFYLARYGIGHADVYRHLDDVISEKVPFPATPFLTLLRGEILRFANTVGIDEMISYRRISEVIWFGEPVRTRSAPTRPLSASTPIPCVSFFTSSIDHWSRRAACLSPATRSGS